MSDFQLTDDQQVAMDMLAVFMKTRAPMAGVLTGFAGTGKTTMIRLIASTFGEPVILAPTGKAALRVRDATGCSAQTIHKWLYTPKEDGDTGETKFTLKKPNKVETSSNRLVVVDEASMVTRELWEHIWDMCQVLDLRVLLVGDPFQLAPVEMNKDKEFKSFSCLTEVDTEFKTHLTQVTRQALDNPILRASMMIRESNRIDQPLRLLNRVFTKNFDDKCMEMHAQGGVVIVHKNVTRHRVNTTIRTRLGYGEALEAGEPLLVLRNNYGLERFNGEVVKFDGWQRFDNEQVAVRDRWKNISMMLTFGAATNEGRRAMLCPEQVTGKAAEISESIVAKASERYYENRYVIDPNELTRDEHNEYIGPPHLTANFGYALSCHKSQGSEWDTGLVLVESSVRPTTYEGRRWLYTALTRFKKSCYFSMEAA